MSPISRRGWRRGAEAAFAMLKAAAPLFLFALVLTGCGGAYPQSSVNPATDFADTIQSLYVQVFWWSMLILAVVWGILAYILVRFRERPDSPTPKQTHGHLGLEVAWTIGPAIIVVAIAIPTIQAVFRTQSAPEEDALRVNVIGHRFWWEFQYPESGIVTANELHLPVGRQVSLRMHSADVIHSFWVPRLGGKRDVNPMVATPEGENPDYNWLNFTVRQAGVYSGQCAEFCGTAHSLMGVRVVAQSPEEFEQWERGWLTPSPTAAPPAAEDQAEGAAQDTSEEARTGPPPALSPQEELIARGRDVFLNQSFCSACHSIHGTSAQGNVGPNLTRLGSRGTIAAGVLENSPENLARWIRDPESVKPGVQMPGVNHGGGGWPATNLSDEQVEALVAYLSSLY